MQCEPAQPSDDEPEDNQHRIGIAQDMNAPSRISGQPSARISQRHQMTNQLGTGRRTNRRS